MKLELRCETLVEYYDWHLTNMIPFSHNQPYFVIKEKR